MVQTALDRPLDRSTGIQWRIVALLFGSVAFVLNASVAVHELGHLVTDRMFGLGASMVLEPLGGSHTVLTQPWPADMSVWPIVAGPVTNVAVGVLLFLGLWTWRSPYLLPLLLWGPIALIQESTTALVQLGTREAGTDWVLINGAGMPAGLIVALAVVGLAAGFLGLYSLLPVSGLEPETPLVPRLGMLVLGMGGYAALTLGLALALDNPGVDVSRNLRIAIFIVLIASLLAVTYPAVSRFYHAEVMEVPRGAVWTALALGAVVFTLFLLA